MAPSLLALTIPKVLARVAFAGSVDDIAREKLASWRESDWQAFFQYADNEDLLNIVLAAIADEYYGNCPDELRSSFEAKAAQRRQWSALRLRLLHEVLQGLKSAGIAARTIKGFALGADVYGDALLRDSHDIDLVVAPQQSRLAAEWLQQHNYRCECDCAWFSNARFLNTFREATFSALGGMLEIDLHWRINQHWLPPLVSVAELLASEHHPLSVGGTMLDWYPPDHVALIQAANIINSWDAELRSMIDFGRSVARLSQPQLDSVIMRCDSSGSGWIFSALAHAAGALSDNQLQERVGPLRTGRARELARSLASEALGSPGTTTEAALPSRRNNRRFVGSWVGHLRLLQQRAGPGWIDYAGMPASTPVWSMWLTALARKLRQR